MTAFSREAVYAALFARVSSGEGGPGLITWGTGGALAYTSRRVRLWDDLPTQPALCQAEHGETIMSGMQPPYWRVLKATWVIYHKVSSGDVSATTDNQILDAAEAALLPVAGEPGYLDDLNTLGGLVHHCFVEGQIIKVPGDLDNQALLTVPISMIVPA